MGWVEKAKVGKSDLPWKGALASKLDLPGSGNLEKTVVG
jgi:hypothetical protein